MDETFEERLAAVERALTDGDHDCAALAEGAATADRVEELESELDELTDRVAELEAATQALRGYVGNVRSVNNDIEARAETALSKAQAAHRIATGNAPESNGSADGPSAVDGTASPNHSDVDGDRTPESVDRCSHCNAPLGRGSSDSGDTIRGGGDHGTPETESDRHRERGHATTRQDGPHEHREGESRAGTAATTDIPGESRIEDLGGSEVGAGTTQATAGFGDAETDGGVDEAGSGGKPDSGLLALIRDAV